MNSTSEIIKHMVTEICKLSNGEMDKTNKLIIRLDELLKLYAKERENV